MRYVGMDIHSKTTTFCVIDDEGNICKRGKVDSSESQWLGVVSHWPGEEVTVALESGNMTWWVVDALRSAGIEPVVVDARQFKLISHSKQKSDKHDARALADALRGGLAQRYSVHVPREIARRGRSLLSTRHLIVKQSVAQWNAAPGHAALSWSFGQEKGLEQGRCLGGGIGPSGSTDLDEAFAGHPPADVGVAGGRAQVA